MHAPMVGEMEVKYVCQSDVVEAIEWAATYSLSMYNPRIPFLLLLIINFITIDSSS
jgi:hypothetical protein